MGQQIAKLFKSLFENKKARILLLGLDAAGKTTILYKLKLDENVVTIPTIGFNVDSIQYKSINFTMWDLGGQDRIRPLWRHYYNDIDAVIFVVDSNDRERIDEAREVMHSVLDDDQLKDVKVLILGNKQDLPHSLSAFELNKLLKLKDLKQKQWFLQPCSALHGNGLFEGLDWLASVL